jgi:hypothetical protein
MAPFITSSRIAFASATVTQGNRKEFEQTIDVRGFNLREVAHDCLIDRKQRLRVMEVEINDCGQDENKRE